MSATRALGAQAADRWTPVTTVASGDVIFIDRQSIRRTGDRIIVWQRRELAQTGANGARVRLSQWEYNCVARSQNLLTLVILDGDGRTLSSDTVIPANQVVEAVVPETVVENVLRAVCR
jgi:hypothetical protein